MTEAAVVLLLPAIIAISPALVSASPLPISTAPDEAAEDAPVSIVTEPESPM